MLPTPPTALDPDQHNLEEPCPPSSPTPPGKPTLAWRHYRGDATASGTHHTYDPGHAPEVAWYLPDEDPADL